MFKLSKTLLALSVLLAVLAIMFAGCYEKAQPSSQAKTETKSSLAAPAKTNAPACKAAVKKECKMAKKPCPAKAAKKCGVADANAVKTCPMKGKKPSDANMAAKPCEKMMCALGDGKAANKSICCEHKGKKYCFCCEGCKKQFEKDPEKYTGKCK
ncbi:MAG: YHS domain-containing protein [Sedimentisphaerales bacterium]